MGKSDNKETISVIITVVEKDKMHLQRCLSSLELSAKEADVQLKHIIIANGTIIPNPQYLIFPFQVINISTNIGFGRAINRGMEKAKSEWCLIVAPDTETNAMTLTKLLQHRIKPQVGIIGPKILYKNGSLDFSIIAYPTVWNVFLEQSYFYKILPLLFHHPYADKTLYEEPHEVDALASTFWLIRRDYFEKVGRFDERFFLFYDDIDLCHRLRSQQKRIFFEPKAPILHYGHGSGGGKKRADFFIEGLVKYLRKHSNHKTISIILILVWIGSFARFIYWYAKNLLSRQDAKKSQAKEKLHFYKTVLLTLANS